MIGGAELILAPEIRTGIDSQVDRPLRRAMPNYCGFAA